MINLGYASFCKNTDTDTDPNLEVSMTREEMREKAVQMMRKRFH
jgi:hypothetical protein